MTKTATVAHTKERYRMRGMDGLRALSALAVLAYHLLGTMMPGGFLGVDVFFVLSGFLITGLALKEYERTGLFSIYRFWVRRIRRLFPAVLLMVTVVLPILPLVSKDLLVGISVQVLATLAFVYNWVELATGSYFTEGNPHIFLNVWSLAVEQQFYLLWPLVLFAVFVLLKKRHRFVVPLLFAFASAGTMWVLIARGASFDRVYLATDTHSFGLMAGAALALVLPRPLSCADVLLGSRAVWVRGTGAWIGLAALFVCFFLVDAQSKFTYPWGIALATVSTVLILIGLVDTVSGQYGPGRVLMWVLDWRPLVWLGERSYGIYLWHWPIFVIFGVAFPQLNIILAALLITTFSIICAELSYAFVETPMRKYGIGAVIKHWWQKVVEPSNVRRFSFTKAITPFVIAALVTTLAVYALVSAPARTTGQQAVESGRVAQEKAAKEKVAKLKLTPAPKAKEVTGAQVSIVGDSVTLSAAEALHKDLPGVALDAAVSRSVIGGFKTIETLVEGKALRPYVVVGLATNTAMKQAQLGRLLQLIGPERKLILVTGFGPSRSGWIAASNQVIIEFAKAHPKQVTVADWSGAIAPRVELLAGDMVHPKPEGTVIYAQIVNKALKEAAQK